MQNIWAASGKQHRRRLHETESRENEKQETAEKKIVQFE